MKLNRTAKGLIPLSFLLMAAGAHAQPAPVSQLPWGANMSPIGLGGGVEIEPGMIEVRSPSLVDPTTSNPPNLKWEDDDKHFYWSDYSSLATTMNNLHANAWVDYNSLTASGSFSFDWASCLQSQSNHRRWEVDAIRMWKAYIPKPTLAPAALADVNNSSNFESVYGNYAVTGIDYRRLIRIIFDATVTSSASAAQVSAAAKASCGCFQAGGSASDTFSALAAFSSVTVTIEIEGDPKAGTLISVGSSGDVQSLMTAVGKDLKQWNTAPTDPNQAGVIDTIYVTPYSAIPPGPAVTPQPTPDQVDLQAAIVEYVTIQNAIQRLSQIQTTDANLNPQLAQYLFGKTDSHGNHIAGTGKQDEANSDLVKEYAYMRALAAGGRPTDPEIDFSFTDPDVVQWRVVNALYDPHSAVGAVPTSALVEIYSNARVMPQLTNTDAVNWGTDWYSALEWGLTSEGAKYQHQSGNQLTEDLSYTLTYLDPFTGIPHRYALFRWENPPGPGTFTFRLIDSSGNQFYNALDWHGNLTPTLQLPAGDFLQNHNH